LIHSSDNYTWTGRIVLPWHWIQWRSFAPWLADRLAITLIN
jgi:hypothetical protein